MSARDVFNSRFMSFELKASIADSTPAQCRLALDMCSGMRGGIEVACRLQGALGKCEVYR